MILNTKLVYTIRLSAKFILILKTWYVNNSLTLFVLGLNLQEFSKAAFKGVCVIQVYIL